MKKRDNYLLILTGIMILALSFIANTVFGQTIAKGRIISETPVTGYILQTDDFGNNYYSPWDGWTKSYKGYVYEGEVEQLLFVNETDSVAVFVYGNSSKNRVKRDIDLKEEIIIIQ